MRPVDVRVRHIAEFSTDFTQPAAQIESSESLRGANSRCFSIAALRACRLVALGTGAKDATITVVTSSHRGEVAV
jgi:hypothetical protein